ncbi:FAD-dependent monooxygenase OpS4 [Lachnellula cervina]|uniref:FAD-dependent monooxygenase OpS4 n=1 Tax=Lachnellula cervina TaxID=1316786 RepID=A0A7D8YQ31_9HELO|nr:FAD-dependent monooxygenase OpS4 [Lachnellula cervina]
METLRDDGDLFTGRMAVRPLNVIINGAGIAGLTAGLALAQTGHSVTILECVSRITEIGAGIQLAPNASRILHRLGVLDEVMKETSVLSRVSIRRYDSDEELNSAPLMPSIGDRYGAPMGVIHRGDLQRILLNAAKKSGCQVLTSQTVMAADPSFSPRLQVRDNKTGTTSWFLGDLVLAADGIQSTLRKQMVLARGHKDQPTPTGDAAYRLLIPRERIQHDAMLLKMLDQDVAMRYMGPGGHIMAYPVMRNTVYNIVLLHPAKTTTKDVENAWTTKGSRKEMMAFYSSWSPAISAWLEYADDEILEWTLNTYPPLPSWVQGSVALIGDACHSMLPYVAQGAANAMEDAAVLMTAFTCTADVPSALRIYEAVRKERAEKIAASAAATGQSLHLLNGPEQQKRDEAIRNAGKEKQEKNTDHDDKWRDASWQDYMWRVDVMRETLEKWEELTAAPEKQPTLRHKMLSGYGNTLLLRIMRAIRGLLWWWPS